MAHDVLLCNTGRGGQLVSPSVGRVEERERKTQRETQRLDRLEVHPYLGVDEVPARLLGSSCDYGV